MAWTTIVADDVSYSLTDVEYKAYTTRFLAPGQSSPLPDIIEKVVNHVRGYVAANASNTLGPAGTIPDKLLDAAVIIIRHRLLTRMRIKIDEDRRKEYEGAEDLLKTVAAGKFAIEEPETASSETQNQGVPGPQVPCKRRRWDRRDQDGI